MRATIAFAVVVVACSMAWRAQGQAPFARWAVRSRGLPGGIRALSPRARRLRGSRNAEEGLGPAFNGTSCAACHNVPAIGGIGLITEVRAGIRRQRRVPAGSKCRRVRRRHAVSHVLSAQSRVSADAASRGERHCPAYAHSALRCWARGGDPRRRDRALADPTDRNRDGISGRAAVVRDLASGDRRIGRFGWKAQHATLRAFAGDAYRNEMGITNEVVPRELAVGISLEAMRSATRFPIRRTSLTLARASPRSTTSTRSCDSSRRRRETRSPRPSAKGSECSQRSAACVPRPGTDGQGRQRIRCSIVGPCRSSPTFCCTTSEPAMALARRRHWRTRFARPRCGVYVFGESCCTTARRAVSKRPSCGMRRRRALPERGLGGWTRRPGPRCSPSLVLSECSERFSANRFRIGTASTRAEPLR